MRIEYAKNAVRNDINEVFTKGGKPLIDFLDYCVRSIQMDPVFLFLVREYRNGPTPAKAVALYEMFCAPNAPARISAQTVLPPYDVRLREAIILLTPSFLPAKYLFDSVVRELEKRPRSSAYVRRYKTDRTPVENLPHGKMTPAQRHFVEKIWQPVIRPHLVAAGFWRVASVA